jgi:DNA-binding transcriptional LysR family regulator
MKTDDIEAFVAVIRNGSLSLAAETLGLTQSAVTRRIQNLEDALGAELLDRNTKPLTPTPLGQRVYEQSVTVMREISALRELVNQEAEPQGVLRLGVPQTLGEAALLHVLPRLKTQFAQVQIQVSNGWGSYLVERMAQGALEGAAALFPAGKTFPPGVKGHSLMKLKLHVVAAKGMLPYRCSLSDCQKHGWILNPDGCGFRAGLQHALAEQGQTLRLNMETYGTELQLGLVAEGLGLGLIPAPLLISSAHCDRVEIIHISEFKPEVALWLLQPPHLGNLQAAVLAFGNDLASALQQRS